MWKSIRLQRTDGSWDEYTLESGAKRVELRDDRGECVSLGAFTTMGSSVAQAQNLPRNLLKEQLIRDHQWDSLRFLYSGTASEDLAQRLRSQWRLAFPHIVDSWKARGFGFPNHRIDPSQSQARRAYHSIDPGFVGGDETVVSITPNTTFRQLQGTEINEKVSEAHRADPHRRRWDTSYTKRIVDRLKVFRDMKLWGPGEVDALSRAVELLTDYHKTMHVPYEARDKAIENHRIARNTVAYWQAKWNRLAIDRNTAASLLNAERNKREAAEAALQTANTALAVARSKISALKSLIADGARRLGFTVAEL